MALCYLFNVTQPFQRPFSHRFLWLFGRAGVVLWASALIVGTTQAQITTVPIIRQQPQPVVTPLGSNAVFDVVAEAGTSLVRYQWRLNGGNLPGETGSVLRLNDVQLRHAGTYSVAVATDAGAVSSDDAELEFGDIISFPFSDLFAGSTPLNTFQPALAGVVRGENLGATAEPGEPFHLGKLPRRSVWTTWVAPATPGIVTFRTVGSGFDTVLSVYEGNVLAQLSEMRSDDDNGGFLTSQLSFRAQPQTAYRIVVDGFAGAQGRFMLGWNFESTADVLPLFTSEPIERAFTPGTDAVFAVTTATNYSWQWFFDGSPLVNETQAVLRVRNANIANVGLYFCRGFSGSLQTGTNGARFRDTRTVRLQLNSDEFGVANPDALSTEKLFDVRLLAEEPADPGRNHAKSSRPKSVAHGFSGTQVFSTIGSTKEVGEPLHCGVIGGASEWFAYQADASGLLSIDTDGSNFDTVLAVYTGPGDSFASLEGAACDNDSGADGKDSRVSFPATAGTIYWIAVDGVNQPNGNPAKGSVVLHYRLVLPLNLSAMDYSTAAGGTMRLRVSGTPNLLATVQVSSDLDPAGWLSLFTNASSSGVFFFTNTGVEAFPNRYYRAVNRF